MCLGSRELRGGAKVSQKVITLFLKGVLTAYWNKDSLKVLMLLISSPLSFGQKLSETATREELSDQHLLPPYF